MVGCDIDYRNIIFVCSCNHTRWWLNLTTCQSFLCESSVLSTSHLHLLCMAISCEPCTSTIRRDPMSSASSSSSPAVDSASALPTALDRALQLESEEYSHQHPNDARLAARGNVKDVDIADVTMTVQGAELLTLARIRLMHGRKYGLVGRNGIGQQTQGE